MHASSSSAGSESDVRRPSLWLICVGPGPASFARRAWICEKTEARNTSDISADGSAALLFLPQNEHGWSIGRRMSGRIEPRGNP